MICDLFFVQEAEATVGMAAGVVEGLGVVKFAEESFSAEGNTQ